VHNYITLVKFLIEPLLENPDELKFDCETNTKGDRIWIRVAFDSSDKGRIFGRNGRTIQAIRTLLTTAANNHNQIVRFDVFDPEPITEKSTDKFGVKPSEISTDRLSDKTQDNSLDKSQNTVLSPSFSKPKLKSELKLE